MLAKGPCRWKNSSRIKVRIHTDATKYRLLTIRARRTNIPIIEKHFDLDRYLVIRGFK